MLCPRHMQKGAIATHHGAHLQQLPFWFVEVHGNIMVLFTNIQEPRITIGVLVPRARSSNPFLSILDSVVIVGLMKSF